MAAIVVDKDTDRGIATVTLNRPEVGNALNERMHRELREAWRDLADADDIRGVVLTAAGDRWFCTGRDVKELAEAQRRGEQVERDAARSTATAGKGFLPAEFPKPVLVALNGSVVGGGWAFVVDADLAVAARGTQLIDRHAQAGQFGGFARIFDSLPHKIAIELMLTGASLTAERAAELGLVNRVVDREDLLDESMAMMDVVVGLPRSAGDSYIRAIRLMRREANPPARQELLRTLAATTRDADDSKQVVGRRFGRS